MTFVNWLIEKGYIESADDKSSLSSTEIDELFEYWQEIGQYE